MISKIDGLCYKNMIDYGLRNLNKHYKAVNKMNVFPVPDGDTGTNMLTTLQKGLTSVDDNCRRLSEVAKKFSKTVVFEARGNSGVILSQFLKGFSETFFNVEEADGEMLIKALENGVSLAYSAVSNPVEGTMLTVLREATEGVKERFNGTQNVKEIISLFLEHGKMSLEGTPTLLPTLREAGVVDSGGAGIVYIFEGIKKYFDGETLEEAEESGKGDTVDYSVFNEESTFEYGYCVEFLLQLLKSKGTFSYKSFKKSLESFGSSLVTSFDEGKVRVHIHTEYPEAVLSFCHDMGEFLAIKIENMTVQHTGLENKIIYSPEKERGAFSVVAVAFDRSTQKLLLDMGADAVIFSEESASAKDYIDAAEQVGGEEIIVFPNSSDSILTALQAKSLYKKSGITVINSRGLAECYASLPYIDFEETNVERVADSIAEIINNLYVVSISGRNNFVYDGEKRLEKKEYYAFSGKEIITVSKSVAHAVIQTISHVLEKQEREIITFFYNKNIDAVEMEEILASVRESGIDAEIFSVPVDKMQNEIVISFE